MRTRWFMLLSLFSLALGGCSGSATVEQSPELVPLNTQEISTQVTPLGLSENPLQLTSIPEAIEMPTIPPPVEKFVALSKKDLANRLQIEADKIALVKTEEQNWLNAALGCPSPGIFYAEGRVRGYQIWLEAEGKVYDYHTDFTGQVILCPELEPDNTDSFPPTTSSPTPRIGVPID